MDGRLYGNYGAKGGIEMALFDILGKHFETAVYDLLGGLIQDSLPLSRSASQSDLGKDLAEVKEFLDEGYRIITVKVGVLGVQQDIERVRAIRELVGSEVSLRADANQGWDVPTALKFIKEVKGCSLEFIEQPLPKWDLDGLAYLRSKSLTPIMADETATTESDVIEIIRKKAADFISIKVIKSGGIMRSRRIAALAHSVGINCYLGSQCETSVGTSASLHFALSTERFDYGGEIYGPQFFVEDVVTRSVRIERGHIYPSDEPGFGIELDMEKVKEFSIED
jgi:L-alanine-DL-glutamate epimerase-like enolase superfamily enzyme